MKIVPLRDQVVVRRMETEETTAGGIVLPDAAREQPTIGRVVSVGEGRRGPTGQRTPVSVAEGDRVVFSRYAGCPLKVNGDEFVLLSEDDILARVQ